MLHFKQVVVVAYETCQGTQKLLAKVCLVPPSKFLDTLLSYVAICSYSVHYNMHYHNRAFHTLRPTITSETFPRKVEVMLDSHA